MDASKVDVSSFLPKKANLITRQRKWTCIYKTYVLQIAYPLITHNKINPYPHINVKGLHFNSYDDMQLTRNFINFIENG